MSKETAAFPVNSSKTWKHMLWTIHVPLERFADFTPVSFCFHSFYEQLEDCGVNDLANGLKTLTLQKTACSLIHNPVADTSALAWLLVFEDFGSSSPVNGVSNGSITTFLQTSPSISAVRFLSLLCLVITIPPFRQDKACCKLNESPQTHSVSKLVYIEGKIASVCF